ncbi:MAG: GNAT family N-acetyltransferase [Nisaea sp.]|uniref:GNAT family N-acetyltransferase n=1 Tax=Nisaea sp. TaxID=2024842 RepID=UPI001B067F7E|nr:GNAT family N-acetyltransferase [Nisaea sp.]MBO6559359.1 GNAT family N-acetyltransferase [Nisaea sp.]
MSAETAEIVLRRAGPADEGTIRRWLVAPHVARRTYRLFSDIVETLEDVLRDPLAGLFIAELDDRPIGLVHVYKAQGDQRWAGVADVTERTRAIDFLIGATDMVNKKLGRRMLNALAAQVFRDPGIDRIVVCPHADNWPAIIALKRAGFREKGRHPDAALNAMYLTVTPATLKK